MNDTDTKISRSTTHFLLLCDTIQKVPHLAPYIITLSIIANPDHDPTDPTPGSTDFSVEDEELVFGFFKATTSLFKIYHIKGYPRLQLRMFSAKYTSQAYRALDLLRLYYPEDDSNDALIRYLYYIPLLKDLRVEVVVAVEKEIGIFDEREKKKFRKADSLAMKRAVKSLGCSHTAITLLEIQGTFLPNGFNLLVETSPNLSMLFLAVEFYPTMARILSAVVNPNGLSDLVVHPLVDQGQPLPFQDIARFVNLEDLEVTGGSITPDFVEGLSKFKELQSLKLLGPVPIPSSVLLPLRFTSIRKFDFVVPASVQVGRERRLFRDGHREAGLKRGSLKWYPGWSAELIKEVMALAEEKGIELEGIAMWDTAILMSREADDERDL